MNADPKEVSSSTVKAVHDVSADEHTVTAEQHDQASKPRKAVDWLLAGVRRILDLFEVILEYLMRRIRALLPPKKFASKSYRFLARQLGTDLESVEDTPKIVFSSTGDLDANSEVLLMLAYFLQDEFDCKVLLIDGTFSRGGVSNYLGIDNAVGFADYLCGEHWSPASLTTVTANDNIYVMPAGSDPLLKQQRFDPAALELRLKAAGDGFRYVLIQQDCILNDSRYLDFNDLADLVLLHVAEGETRISDLEACQKAYDDHMIQGVKLVLSE